MGEIFLVLIAPFLVGPIDPFLKTRSAEGGLP
jgi:hypothetical protein